MGLVGQALPKKYYEYFKILEIVLLFIYMILKNTKEEKEEVTFPRCAHYVF